MMDMLGLSNLGKHLLSQYGASLGHLGELFVELGTLFVQGQLFSSILDKRMQKKELYQPVSFVDQCARFARINVGAPVGNRPYRARIFVIMPVFW